MEYRIKKVSYITPDGAETEYRIQGRFTNILKIFGWSYGEFSFGSTFRDEKEAVKYLNDLRNEQLKIKQEIVLNI